MRWKQTPDTHDPMDWNRWFCWFPVKFNGHWIWWEWLQRKRVHQESVGGGLKFISVTGWWAYREDSPLEESLGENDIRRWWS